MSGSCEGGNEPSGSLKAICNPGWSYKDVLPYFKKSENNLDPFFANDTKFHSTGGYLSVSQFPYEDRYTQAIFDASTEVGFKPVDFNSDHVSGVMRLQATQENGKRMSTNLAFLKPIRNKRENLHIATGVRVTKLLIHAHNKTAYGVQYVSENQRNRTGKVFASREVILSAGAFNSPQILLLSGIGPEVTLKKLEIPVIQNSKVGYNLQDHYTDPGIRFKMTNTQNITKSQLEILPGALKYIRPKRTGPWSCTATSQIDINYQSTFVNKSIEYPDIQINFFPNSTCGGGTNPFVYYDIINFIPILLRPKSRGLVTINTTDPFSHPIIYTNYFNASQDIDTVLEASKVAHQLANTTAFKKVGLVLDTTYEPTRSQIETGSNPFWKQTPVEFMYSICHPCGTCKMGPDSDPDAVVDAQLKVYGIANLRVVDASIMPTITSGNLNAGVIMIAEKAADLIKKSHS
ncbi:hypothetical protein ANN_19385 [Periplaneta americana]|uniref:Glucose-methanol-choline oxidoreductase N-terminal domain-containing protein n=1 Tax=Periplaneta americana TaxID=6978 RepID=A0ABQ8S9T5_PERAM|nr:hypothetical protein ANN_19385 [Periplaneta americana]